MECVIDTNALVYDMMEDTELHARAKEALDSIDLRIIPVTVVEEFARVLTNLNVERSAISKKLREILGDENIVQIGQKGINEAVGIIESEGTTFKRFNDKLILEIAKERDIPLLTFDRELIKECNANGVKLFQ